MTAKRKSLLEKGVIKQVRTTHPLLKTRKEKKKLWRASSSWHELLPLGFKGKQQIKCQSSRLLLPTWGQRAGIMDAAPCQTVCRESSVLSAGQQRRAAAAGSSKRGWQRFAPLCQRGCPLLHWRQPVWPGVCQDSFREARRGDVWLYVYAPCRECISGQGKEEQEAVDGSCGRLSGGGRKMHLQVILSTFSIFPLTVLLFS